MRARNWVGLVLVLFALNGCVYTGVKKLPDNWQAGKTKPVCDTSKIPVYLDALWSATYIGNAVVIGVVLPSLNEMPTNPLSYVFGVVFAVAGIVHATSALQGTEHVQRCRRAKLM